MKKLIAALLLAGLTATAQDFTYSTNLFYALNYQTNIFIGTNSTDTNGDSFHVWVTKINHNFNLTALWYASTSNNISVLSNSFSMGLTTNLQFVDATVVGGVVVASRTNTLYFTNGLLMGVTQP